MLIAYENGLLIVWDASQDSVVCVRGYKDLHVNNKTVVNSPNDMRHELSNDTSDNTSAEKDISSLCWASANGSILAVGYVDGDIILWKLSTDISAKDQPGKSSDNVVKLQLSSGSRRLPVIMLYWSEGRSSNDCGGHLFIYGGDAIGSEEVLTVQFQFILALLYSGICNSDVLLIHNNISFRNRAFVFSLFSGASLVVNPDSLVSRNLFLLARA